MPNIGHPNSSSKETIVYNYYYLFIGYISESVRRNFAT